MSTDRSWVNIDLSAWQANLKALKLLLPQNQSILQIVKADAYGHGAYEIAQQASQLGVAMFGVANAAEGALLRHQGIKKPILILSPSFIDEIDDIIEFNLTPAVHNLGFAAALNSAAPKPWPVHLNFDTGMGRSGVPFDEAQEFLQDFYFENVFIEGVFSHYASSESDPAYTLLQSQRFEQILNLFSQKPMWVHLANSGGVLQHNPSYTNLVRLGIASYGVYTNQAQQQLVKLKPVMSFHTKIGALKQALPGQSIGYNRTCMVNKPLTYAILPVGYADGYDFLLSGKGQVLVNGVLCPVLGRISMDMTAVDVSAVPNVKPDDQVLLLGDHPNLKAEQLAAVYNGSAYELLCQIGRRARRFYLQNGGTISVAPQTRRTFVPTDFSTKGLNRVIELAMNQRLQSHEVANLLYHDVVQRFFATAQRDPSWRSNFEHSIDFSYSKTNPDYYEVNTSLSYNKVIAAEYFIIACAHSQQQLETYFDRKDVEYRWLLDKNIALKPEFFNATRICIDGTPLKTKATINNGCLELTCQGPALTKATGKTATLSIATRTYYPRQARQLSVYIGEITKGVNISFSYPKNLLVEAVPVFAGRNHSPKVVNKDGLIEVHTLANEWVFPLSGVIFAYGER